MSRIIKWVFLLGLFLSPSLASAQCTNTVYGHWTCIQAASGFQLTAAPAVATFGSSVASGHLIIAEFTGCIGSVNGCDIASNTWSVTDTLNGSYTCPTNASFQDFPGGLPSNRAGMCFFCGTGSGADAATFVNGSGSGNQNFMGLFIQEWSSSDGACSGGGIDAVGTNFSAAGASPFVIATSGNTSQTNEVAISMIAVVCCALTSVSGPFAVLDSSLNSHGYEVAVQSAATVATYTASWNSPSSSKWVGVTATFTRSLTPSAGHRHSSIIKWNPTQQPSYRIPFNRSRKILSLEKI
jgi:hypothetical protein